jgi:K+-sensing histidine kinase KdpD
MPELTATEVAHAGPDDAAEVFELVGIVAHDLVNPLNGVALLAKSLQRRLAGDQDAQASVAAMLDATGRMERILRSLTELGRLHSPGAALSVAPHRQAVLLEEAVAMARPALVRGVQLQLRGGSDVPVSVDRARFVRALASLIELSIHRSPDGGTVSVSGEIASSKTMRILIEDDAPVTEDEQRRAFDWLARAKNRNDDGAWLSIAVATGVIEAHRGRCSIEARGTTGSATAISFPGDLVAASAG